MNTTGIRQTNTGSWAAIREGVLVDTFKGPGAKREAILAAGTNAPYPSPTGAQA